MFVLPSPGSQRGANRIGGSRRRPAAPLRSALSRLSRCQCARRWQRADQRQLWAPITGPITRRYGAPSSRRCATVTPAIGESAQRSSRAARRRTMVVDPRVLASRRALRRPQVVGAAAAVVAQAAASGGRVRWDEGFRGSRPGQPATSRARLTLSRAGSSGWQGRRATRLRLPGGRRCQARSRHGRP